MAVTPSLVLRFADVGVATYASLRVVGDPSRTLTWVVQAQRIRDVLDELAGALPDPAPGESVTDALTRALTAGPLWTQVTEYVLAQRLSEVLLSDGARLLLLDHETTPRAVLFVSPSAALGRVPWGLLAVTDRSVAGSRRLIDVVDVLIAVPPNIVNAPRPHTDWADRRHGPPLLILDPRVPGQRADSALGSVLGRPSAQTLLAGHFRDDVAQQRVLPAVAEATDLFRRTDADRDWLARMLTAGPRRLLYVGHASAAQGRADQAALHLAEDRPLTAADVMSRRLPMPPRVALIACASGGDYRFDEATGLVAAMVLCGAQLVTATLWSLPTTAGYRLATGAQDDPMAELVAAVDAAHEADDAGRAVNQWQRDRLQRWRSGDASASPLYWAALATFAVDGVR